MSEVRIFLFLCTTLNKKFSPKGSPIYTLTCHLEAFRCHTKKFVFNPAALKLMGLFVW